MSRFFNMAPGCRTDDGSDPDNCQRCEGTGTIETDDVDGERCCPDCRGTGLRLPKSQREKENYDK